MNANCSFTKWSGIRVPFGMMLILTAAAVQARASDDFGANVPPERWIPYSEMALSSQAAQRGTTQVYSNTVSSNFYSIGQLGAFLADDLITEAGCGCDVSSYSVRADGGGGGTYAAQLALFDGCPGDGGTLIAGTDQIIFNIPDTGPVDVVADLSAAPVFVDRSIWLRVTFSTDEAGIFVGSAPELGSSADIYFNPFTSCLAGFTGGQYASFAAQVFCSGGSEATEPTDPTPADGATGVALDSVLAWNEIDARGAGQAEIDQDNKGALSEEERNEGRRLGCLTQEKYAAKVAARGGARGGCFNGSCDLPSTRDAYIPDASTPFKIYRLRMHIFCEDNGSNCSSTTFQVDDQVETATTMMEPYRIRFVHTTVTHNDSQYRVFDAGEEAGMKQTYADSPDTQINVFITSTGSGSWGTFPWDSDSLQDLGGIVMDTSQFCSNCATLAHEVGHCIGLWHTHHGGSDEVDQCGSCWEPAGSSSDTTGDLCSDTVPEPRQNFSCSNPGTTDPCSGLPWGNINTRNIMSYTSDPCSDFLTPQQAGRAHCWTEATLTSWLEPDACLEHYDVYFGTDNPPTTRICADIEEATCDPGPLDCDTTYFWQVDALLLGSTASGPVWSFSTIGGGDCNNNSIPDDCEIADGSAQDCNGNGLPDDCDTAIEDCNSNGIPDDCESDCQPNGAPDDCDITSGASEDCQPNGIPDECDIAGGASSDNNANSVPDECEASPPIAAPSPHDTVKNRYLAFTPNNGSNPVAFSVLLPDGRTGWVGEPVLKSYQGIDPQWVAWVEDSANSGADQVRDWSGYLDGATGENVVLVTGCVVVPDESYEIRTANGQGFFTNPLNVDTAPDPALAGSWADCVGVFDAGTMKWTGPNDATNFSDIGAMIDGFQAKDTVPISWVDLDGQFPNYQINFADIDMTIKGFQEIPYPVPAWAAQTVAECALGAP